MVVFKVCSKASGQNYIGACRGNVDQRWELYLRAAEAGLDFPLYNEIREHGEAQFTIEELDYADDIDELKEMELLHTVELAARSLRNYKFGITDAVVKRIRQVDHERAWMKDLPEEPVRVKVAPASKLQKAPSVQSKTPSVQSKTPPVLPRSITPSAIAPKSNVPKSMVQKPIASKPIVSKPTATRSRPEAVSAAGSEPEGSESARVDHSAELDKALFAEGIGLLVRAVASVEQLSNAQQQARSNAQSLSQALAESERVLQQLQVQQDEAALRARLAMEAVAVSQSANEQLMALHRQAKESSITAMEALDQSSDMSIQTAQLQQEFSRLLLRIKVGASASKSTVSQSPLQSPLPPQLQPPAQPVAAVLGSALPTAAIATLQPLDRCVDAVHQRVEVEEAKMVNQLKVLDQLLIQESPNSVVKSEASKVRVDVEVASVQRALEVRSPARAWVATTADDAESALVLVKDAAPATVVLRRSKTPSVGAAAPNRRKTLSIKAR